VRNVFLHFHGFARLLFAALLGVVAGTALQLQQEHLFAWHIYWMIGALALVGYALAAIKNIAIGWRKVLATAALGLLSFGVTGLRATAYLVDALDPALEGRDVQVVGVVASLPQRNESGLRFRLEVESAALDGGTVRVPPLMDVGWYGGAFSAGPAVLADVATTKLADAVLPASGQNRMPADVRAGERWQMTLRLKAPHGSRNPFGFDYELWLWEQGVQATGYVRASAKDPLPQRLAQTWLHPVVLARQVVRERIYRQVAERQFAGMIAALVVGDQAAIDRWPQTIGSLNGFPSESPLFHRPSRQSGR
jgi:competence protein ComEC